ncbi:MAG: prolipoprotein diacylglyceryl transferase [Candidatus Kapabacteria bacterium]|nr:prolipoprotein diacylglyceryl transferase [Candidatus Kapabacteria bacterium]
MNPTHFIWNVHPTVISIGPFLINTIYLRIALSALLIGQLLYYFININKLEKSRKDNLSLYIILNFLIIITFQFIIANPLKFHPEVRWYGLLFALAFILCYWVLHYVYVREAKPLKQLEVLTIYLITGTVLGARLGHCLFYEGAYYLANPVEILFIWNGGLASHGAGIGVTLSVILFAYRYGKSELVWLMDRVSLVVPIAATCVRLGNFFNSEIIGRPADVAWAVVFARLNDATPRHPSQLYEAIAYILIFIFLFITYKSFKTEIPKGRITGYFLTFLFSARFLIEFFKERQVPFEQSMSVDMGQLLSLPFIAFGIFMLWWSFRKKTLNDEL